MLNHYQVELEQQPIELYKLLKIANLVSGGGEAKVMISDGYVLLNGEIETQKRKKIFSGDIIEFNGDLVELICHAEPTITPPRKAKDENAKQNHQQTKKTRTHTANSKKKSANQKPQKTTLDNPSANIGKRRSINFTKD